jgi:hypothetical protein
MRESDMIRKAVIVALALGAVGTFTLSWASTWKPLSYNGQINRSTELTVVVSGGHIQVVWIQPLGTDFSIEEEEFYRELIKTGRVISSVPLLDVRANWGFGINRRSGPGLLGKTYRFAEATAPLWAPCILFAAYPTIAFIRGPLRRWRRRRKDLCIKCSYDLTGNVSGVCPECGRAT